MKTITLTAGGRDFALSVEDGATAGALLEMLPMTLHMAELNGNEKYAYLDSPLPTSPVRVGTIHAGDVMLYGDDCLVVFYETFSTPYSYTPVGHVADASGLAEALGSGDAEVTLSP